MKMSFFASAAIVALLSACSASAAPMAGDGPGCKDKAIAATLIPLKDTDPAYIEIWAKGMVDRSCRGYPIGEEVTVEDRADGMACVRAKDDAVCFWVREGLAPSTLTGAVK
jgi:hypothetical protein